IDNYIACPHQSLALQNIGNIPDGLIGTFEFIVIKASDTPNKAEGIQQMAVPCENIGHCIGAVTGKLKRLEEQTSELQSLMRLSYAVFCLKKQRHHRTAT